jgi:hypothetical protein
MRARLPWAPLERYVLLNTDCSRPIGRWESGLKVDVRSLSEHIGFTHQSIHEWVRSGVPFYSADEAAIRLDTHPLLIWPEWADEPACPQPHGSPGAVAWHRRYGIPMCELCLATERARADRVRVRTPRVPQPCGTVAAYRRHQGNGEQTCPECRAAWSEKHREYYRKRRAKAAP